ncbi:GNAT family N-acetyltransferase [Phytomonospora sp. NPDC050363]|uniref:GNAT family N-acetyltransferase n=1 Tax=Phytomonospora sp. NPDC050363 TaxID=3155642 RepID=UPI00340DBA15
MPSPMSSPTPSPMSSPTPSPTPSPAAVAAAVEAWVLNPPGTRLAETPEYRIALFPAPFPDPLQLQWVRSSRPARAVLDDVVAHARTFGLPEIHVHARLSSPEGFDDALVARGAQLVDTGDILAMGLPSPVESPDVPGLKTLWRTTPAVARDANTIGIRTFGGEPAPDDAVAQRAAADAETVAAGTGGALVAYLDEVPAAIAGVEIVDGVARLWGGGVLEPYRGRGVYRALVAARLAYATEHNATMALTQGRVSTSSPILRRIGFTSYGQEHSYRLPLT